MNPMRMLFGIRLDPDERKIVNRTQFNRQEDTHRFPVAHSNWRRQVFNEEDLYFVFHVVTGLLIHTVQNAFEPVWGNNSFVMAVNVGHAQVTSLTGASCNFGWLHAGSTLLAEESLHLGFGRPVGLTALQGRHSNTHLVHMFAYVIFLAYYYIGSKWTHNVTHFSAEIVEVFWVPSAMIAPSKSQIASIP